VELLSGEAARVDPARPPARTIPLAFLTGALRSAAPALTAYGIVRAVGMLVLALWGHDRDLGLLHNLGHRYDSVWYAGIADHGYDNLDGNPANPWLSNMVFFPLFPMLMRLVAAATPLHSASAGVAVALLCSFAAAWGLYAVGAHVRDRRTGVMLAAVWGVIPHAVVENMAYTEGLFTALAAWSLYAVLTRRWLTAGGLCVLAGLTRPTAYSIIGVVGLAALLAAVRRDDGWRPWVAMVVAPAGWIGYLVWVAARTGRPDGWFHIEKTGWGMSWDAGRYTLDVAFRSLRGSAVLDTYVVCFVMLAAIVLFVLALLDRLPWQLLLYSGLLLVASVGTAGLFHAQARFLIPAFPLLLPVATALAGARTSRAVVVLGWLTLVSAYLGGYLLLVWHRSP
jgi:hypothetical protein